MPSSSIADQDEHSSLELPDESNDGSEESSIDESCADESCADESCADESGTDGLDSMELNVTSNIQHEVTETATNLPEETTDFDEHMFEPVYQNANITVSGAFCAIMEFKRQCRLPFTAITKLLDLLQLLCPPNNKLPKSVYTLKKFFEKLSIPLERRQFYASCNKELHGNIPCGSPCNQKEPNTLITLNSKRAISRVLESKYLNWWKGYDMHNSAKRVEPTY